MSHSVIVALLVFLFKCLNWLNLDRFGNDNFIASHFVTRRCDRRHHPFSRRHDLIVVVVVVVIVRGMID